MMVSVYGRSRIWRKRRDGYWQRYWTSTRFDMRGTGKQLNRAVKLIADKKLAPRRRFIRVQAKLFLDRPERYAQVGKLIGVGYPGRRMRRRWR